MTNTLFSGNEIPKERNHYTCIAAICIDSVLKIHKKNYPHVYLEQCKYKIKKRELVNFIDDDLSSDDSGNLAEEIIFHVIISNDVLCNYFK